MVKNKVKLVTILQQIAAANTLLDEFNDELELLMDASALGLNFISFTFIFQLPASIQTRQLGQQAADTVDDNTAINSIFGPL